MNALLKDIERNSFEGIGKPEPLKRKKAMSRRITHEQRLVYVGNEHQNLFIISCKGHYED